MKYTVKITGIADQDDVESGNHGKRDAGDEVFSVQYSDDIFCLALSSALLGAGHSIVRRMDVLLAETVEIFCDGGHLKGSDKFGEAAREYVRQLRGKRQSKPSQDPQEQET